MIRIGKVAEYFSIGAETPKLVPAKLAPW